MSYLLVYAITLIVFLGIDYLGLSYIVKPVFERDAGHLLREDLDLLPALAFYAVFIAGVIWFVSYPAMTGGKTLLWTFANAGFLGLLAYGTYEFTNLATLKGWSVHMVATDLIWGICLTGCSAVIGVALSRIILGSAA